MQSLFLVCVLPLLGATGTVSDEFTVPVPVERLADWVSRHSDAITRAAGSQIIAQHGPQFTVRKATPRGVVEATMAHEIRRVPGGYLYTCRLVPGSSDALLAYELDCTLTAAGGGSRLSIRVHTETTMRVRDFQLERHMRQNVEKVKALFESLGRESSR